jgi:hypothetical protein
MIYKKKLNYEFYRRQLKEQLQRKLKQQKLLPRRKRH